MADHLPVKRVSIRISAIPTTEWGNAHSEIATIIFASMIEPFSGVKFYIIPSTASRLKENNAKMVSILRIGMALQETTINDNVTHVICNPSDFALAQKTTSDSVFCCYVTPKWVFISQSLHYCLPVVRNGKDWSDL